MFRCNTPLAVGIKTQLVARHPEMTVAEIQAVLSRHTKTSMYLRNVKFGTVRANLDASPAGEITAEQREIARLRPNERSARRAFTENAAKKPPTSAKKRLTREQRHEKKLSKLQVKIVAAVSALQARA